MTDIRSQTQYPTVAAVNIAGHSTLAQWEEELAPPQTDVEHTVRRRITRRLERFDLELLRERDPALAARFEDLERQVKELRKNASGTEWAATELERELQDMLKHP